MISRELFPLKKSLIRLARFHHFILGILSLFFATELRAVPGDWTFAPPSTGRALYSGGWALNYSLGGINASGELAFPLQLVYLTTRQQEGLFGSQWYCPQLESSIIPVGKGYLLWTTPSGGQIAFKQSETRRSEFLSLDSAWQAKVSPTKVELTNAQGWVYEYSKGKLASLMAPSRRILEFEWDRNCLLGIQVRDLVSNNRRIVLLAEYNEDKKIKTFNLDGLVQRFSYSQDGTEERLSAWSPPEGEVRKFLYDSKTGVLTKMGTGNTEDPERVENFKTELVNKNATDPNESYGKKLIQNYWLIQDRIGTYTYGKNRKDPKIWDPASVTLSSGSGLVQKGDYAENRGIVTKGQNGQEQKSYYYRAPGQKYDGKLRRVEENGKLMVEYRYDRKTGLLSETSDGSGKITFYDYDPNFKPAADKITEPQPIRIRKGNRRKSEVVAEYVYSPEGKVMAVRDGHGNLTKYTYTKRGELASVTNPAGDVVSYSYDEYGRMNSVSSSGKTQRMEYDEKGRIKAQIAVDGTRTEIVYDADGQVSQVKRNGAVTKELLRDEFHRVIGEKDALNRISRVERDVRGNLTAQIAPNGSVTRYEYDSSDRRIAQIDGNGNKVSFAYDTAGRLVKQVNALGNTQTWSFDPKSGKLIERRNGEQMVRHKYDAQSRLIFTDYGAGQKLAYAYDKEGRPISITGPDSTFEYDYDEEGRLIASRAACGEDDQLLTYRYNKRGQRTGLLISQMVPAAPDRGELPGEPAHYEVIQQTEQTFDETGNLSSILSNGLPIVSYLYDMAGRPVKKIYGAAKDGKPPMTANLTYDAAGYLAQIEFKGGNLPNPLSLTYEWDQGDQLLRRTWNGVTHRYEYDPGGQLLRVINQASGEILEAYTYDKAGNMLTKRIHGQLTAMTYNAGNQLMNAYDLGTMADDAIPRSPEVLSKAAKSVMPYAYDKAGRMVSIAGQLQNSYGWLDKVTVASRADGARIGYRYWPDGQIATVGGTRSLETYVPNHDVRSQQSTPEPSPFGTPVEETPKQQDSPFGTPIEKEQKAPTPKPTEDSPFGVPISHQETLIPISIEAPAAQLPATITLPEEKFLWDGLALIRRNDTIYLIEPHPSGGIPIASHPVGHPEQITYHLNDMLGTTLAFVSPNSVIFSELTTFGQSLKSTSQTQEFSAPQALEVPPAAPSPSRQMAPAY